MPGLLPHVDPDGLLEYSVVYTDRALNHMSQRFQGVMRDIAATLKAAYAAQAVAVVPGSGTFGMEAVARQFAQDQACLVLRHGWFSYRWSQILEMGRITDRITVLKARPANQETQAAWAPAPLEEVVATILRERPAVVFAPHVETASGMILPDAYVQAVGQAVREVGGLFVLDAIASGAIWVNMRELCVDVLVSAPQKGWSGSPGCAFVMLGERAQARLANTQSTSFAADLKKWSQIMQAYEDGAHAYHATMPTDALARTRDAMLETRRLGFEQLRDRQWSLGARVRALMTELGYPSVAAPAFAAPGVVVCHTRDAGLSTARALGAQGLQSAAGVPLQCDEPAGFQTFRIGLFGLDKLQNIDRTLATLAQALRQHQATQ
jgi:aspartate aminotransferase-like enzyme